MENALGLEALALLVQLRLRNVVIAQCEERVQRQQDDGEHALHHESDFVAQDRPRLRADVADGVQDGQRRVEDERAAVARGEGQREENGLRAPR